MQVNFGGFVPVSTVDWRGRAVCTLFLRGCPARCWYCQNVDLQTGADMRSLEEVLSLIEGSRIVVSGIVFSGGEPTMQGDAVGALARAAHDMDLAVGIHTNGIFPGVLKSLIDEGALDRVALDIKTTWDRYDDLLGIPRGEMVKQSLDLCREAWKENALSECEAVTTVFRGHEGEISVIAREVEPLDLILQQGDCESLDPLTPDDLSAIARHLPRPVRIRTREEGETTCAAEGGMSA